MNGANSMPMSWNPPNARSFHIQATHNLWSVSLIPFMRAGCIAFAIRIGWNIFGASREALCPLGLWSILALAISPFPPPTMGRWNCTKWLVMPYFDVVVVARMKVCEPTLGFCHRVNKLIEVPLFEACCGSKTKEGMLLAC